MSARLSPAGFDIVSSRNAKDFNFTQSLVLIFKATDEEIARGQRVAELLRLPPSAVRVSPLTQSVADVIVIIGADYRP